MVYREETVGVAVERDARVGTEAHRIDVAVKADKATYPVRGTAKVTIEGKLPNGQPAANAEVAVAAVDEALLELLPKVQRYRIDASGALVLETASGDAIVARR